MSHINWFPGHMAKATENLKHFKIVDLIIEVVDARAIQKSSNKEITNIFINKPKLTIALKSDLSSASHSQENQNLLIGSIKNKAFKQKILNGINSLLEPNIQRCRTKGLMNQQFYIVVLGLPNVGKSSLINFLGSKKVASVENRPGVTRFNQMIKLSNNLFLYDTPGVLFKKIEEIYDGYILSLIKCIKKEILPLEDVVKFGYEFYSKFYWPEFANKYGLSEYIDFQNFLELVCKKYGFISQKSILDMGRALNYLFDDFSSGTICKINYEEFAIA